MYADDDLFTLKKFYYENGGYQEYDGKNAIDKIVSSEKDINDDGVNEVFLYHGTVDCGSGGCTGIIYSRINNDYCAIGKSSNGDFDRIKSKSRTYKCPAENEISFIGENGEQEFSDNISKNVENNNKNKPEPSQSGLKDPFKISSEYNGKNRYMYITSKINDITILGIEVNRGNCGVMVNPGTPLPIEVGFGQTLVSILYCKEILEVKVMTNYGDYPYSM